MKSKRAKRRANRRLKAVQKRVAHSATSKQPLTAVQIVQKVRNKIKRNATKISRLIGGKDGVTAAEITAALGGSATELTNYLATAAILGSDPGTSGQ